MQFTPSLVLWYLVVIGILVTAHEYGHYRVAIACKVKVFRFSIGFGRVLWRRPFGPPGCEFTLSAIPLGGYVAMLDKAEDAATPEDAAHALESRPLWQRCAVVLAGPAANLLLAVVFFAAAQFMGTQQTVPVLSTPPAGSLMADAGQRSGDRLVAWVEDGEVDAQGEPRWQPLRSYEDVLEALHGALLDGRGVTFQASRIGTADSHVLALPLDRLERSELDADAITRIGLTMPLSPPLVRETLPGSVALAAGLKAGDLVEAVDGVPVADAQSLIDRIRAGVGADGKARTLSFQLRRDGRTLVLPVQPKVVDEDGRRFGRIGASIGAPFLEELVRDDLGDAIVFGFTQTAHSALTSLRIFGRMIVGQASLKNLNGPLTISDQVRRSAEMGLSRFLSMLAAISVGIGVLNLLPIPVLDGGRLLYYLYEGAAGRPVSTSWQDKLRYGGVFAILLLMSIALSNDLAHLLGQ